MDQYHNRVSGDYGVWKVVQRGSSFTYARVKVIQL